MLQNRLLRGINNDRMQQRLLAEENLMLEKALPFAQAMEAAEQNVRVLQSLTPSNLHLLSLSRLIPSPKTSHLICKVIAVGGSV